MHGPNSFPEPSRRRPKVPLWSSSKINDSINGIRRDFNVSVAVRVTTPDAGWINRNGTAFDVAVVSLHDFREYECAKEISALCCIAGLTVRVETLVTAGNARDEMSALVMSLLAHRWTVRRDRTLPIDEFEGFIALNQRARFELPEFEADCNLHQNTMGSDDMHYF